MIEPDLTARERDDMRAPDTLARGAFVGRERELGELRAGLRASAAGQGGLFMIVGEPGIGKSRLADELSSAARAAGALVTWGRCWEGGGAPAYWPWVQVLRGCSRAAGAELGARLGAGAANVAQLLPEIRALLPELAEVAPTDAERARFHLFDAIATFLKSTASARPLVVVLDDLHAADRPSLLLLQFLAGGLADVPLLILGCYRTLEMRRQRQLAEILGDVARHARYVTPRGLSEAEIGRFIQYTFGLAPAAGVAAAVQRATDGNPFFVDEVVRLLAGEGRLARDPDRLGIPEGVREAIRRRLAPLPAACGELLALAAVVGREFEVACLARACDLPAEHVLEVIADAADAAMIEPLDDGLGRYRFVHVLIRETLYDDLAPARRVALHRTVGRALEELYRGDREPHLAELAHHFLAAAPGGAALDALEYCVRAAERATRLLACEEAVVHYRRGLEALAFMPADERRRCELLLALGEAYDRAGDVGNATATFAHAASVARELGDAETLARAALGSGGEWAHKFTSAIFERSNAGLLEDALAVLDDGDSVLRVKVLVRLGLKLRFLGARERGEVLSGDALEMARRLGDVATLAYTLIVRHGVLLGPDHLDSRLSIADEMLRLADETGDRELELRGYAVRVLDLFEAGDIPALDRDLERYVALARETRDPFDIWMGADYVTARALCAGNVRDGERLAMEAMATAWRMPGQQSDAENSGLCYLAQMFATRRELGGDEELVSLLEATLARFPTVPVLRCILARILLAAGRRDDARRHFEDLAAQDFAAVPYDSVWLGALGLLAEVCFAFGDRARAATLYELLAPYASRNAMLASSSCLGSVARYLGLLAAVLDRWDAGTAHFEAALAMHGRMGARSWLAHTQHDFALMLLAEGAPDGRARALELLRAAGDAAGELGMTRLADAVGRALRDHAPGARSPSAPADHPQGVLRREGEFWTVAYAGATFHLRSSKGLLFLAHLLRHPGREFHAADLVVLVEGADVDRATGPCRAAAASRLAADDLAVGRLGEGLAMLDARAKAAYRARLAELHRDVDDAQACHDAQRAARAQAELDFLSRELARSLGLGGRERCIGSVPERARLNVTRAIRRVLARIAAHHAALGEHFGRTVKTGMFCCYAADPRLAISWLL